MGYTLQTRQSEKHRIIIAGPPDSGKTDSLATFIYGTREYWKEGSNELTEEAIEFAADRKMVVINCPGEKGVKSIPIGPHIERYVYEAIPGKAEKEIHEFEKLSMAFNKGDKKADILVYDGGHKLYYQWMDDLTDGVFSKYGEVLVNYGKRTVDETGRYYGKCHVKCLDWLDDVFNSSVPIVIVTCGQEWENKNDNLTPEEKKNAEKHLWPALPGKMSKGIVGEFDIRLSAGKGTRCLHQELAKPGKVNCQYGVEAKEHYLWQFLWKGEVRGVGIKGLKRVTAAMQSTPFIHQNWKDLQRLISAYS